jgi:hypothetical protein
MEIWYKGRQLRTEICLSVRLTPVFSFCHTHWSSEETVFTVTLIRLFFSGQHLSERLECSEIMNLFLSKVLLLNLLKPSGNFTYYQV